MLTVIAGCVGSGKSAYLLDLLDRLGADVEPALVLKPAVDTRVAAVIRSRDGRSAPARVVGSRVDLARELAAFLGGDPTGKRVLADEVQFFPTGSEYDLAAAAASGALVYVAGLDLDYRGLPFAGPMPALLALADDVRKVVGVCAGCGGPSRYSHRRVTSDALVLIGGDDVHEPLCGPCYRVRTEG